MSSEQDRKVPPPSGWEIPDPQERPPGQERQREHQSPAELLARLVAAIPDDVQVAAIDAVRALLELLRALLDWLAAVLIKPETTERPGPPVHDIPIL